MMAIYAYVIYTFLFNNTVDLKYKLSDLLAIVFVLVA